ncbi:MAG: ABC transporter substrate-binding protein, partial [Alicyclobacillus sp.]|nr:ABC transporter substrate-binding protein [Alicyclobacillus sp.]
LATIKAANPQALFIGTEEVEMGLIAKQARALGITAKIIAGQGADTNQYFNTAGASVAEGTLFDTTYISNDATPEAKAFSEAYQTKFGQVADSHVAKGYDGGMMLLQAIDKAYPNLDGDHIAQALREQTYHGLTGDFKFDNTGEGLFQVKIGVIKNGKPVPYQAQ